MRSRTGTSTQPYQYLGNLYDPDSKLYDFHARAYDSNVGRFTSKDPGAYLAKVVRWTKRSAGHYSLGSA